MQTAKTSKRRKSKTIGSSQWLRHSPRPRKLMTKFTGRIRLGNFQDGPNSNVFCQPRRICNPEVWQNIRRIDMFSRTRGENNQAGRTYFTSSVWGPRRVRQNFGQHSPFRGPLGGSHAVGMYAGPRRGVSSGAGGNALATVCVYFLAPPKPHT